MARIKKIKYEDVAWLINTEKSQKVLEMLANNINGMELKRKNIKNMFQNHNGRYIEFVCPCCGKLSSHSLHYRTTFVSDCCNQKLHIQGKSFQDYNLIYGVKATIDGRECEIFSIKYRSPSPIVVCYDKTNYRRYMWDDGVECNRRNIAKLYSYNKIYCYLDGENFETVILPNYKEQILLEAPSYFEIFSTFEQRIKLERERQEKAKPPKKPKDFDDLIKCNEWVRSGCFHGREAVLAQNENNIVVKVNITEFDLIGDKHKIDAICPNCGKTHHCNFNDSNVHFDTAPTSSSDIINGTIDAHCSCGFDLAKCSATTKRAQILNIFYIDEDSDNIYITKWEFSYNNNVIPRLCYILPKKEDYVLVISESLFKENIKAYLEYYNQSNNVNFSDQYTMVRLESRNIVSQTSRFHYQYNQVINNAPSLKYSNITEVISLIPDSIMQYVYAYKKNNILESVSKIFPSALILNQVINKIIGNIHFVYICAIFEREKCDTIEDIFNLSKTNFKLFAKMTPVGGYDSTLHAYLCLASKYNEVATEEQIRYFTENEVAVAHVIDIYNDLPDVKMQEIINYLEHCRQYQCIEPLHAIVLWKDYIHNALKIGIDLNDKKARRPCSLKMEHDILAYKTKMIKDKEKEDAFITAVRQNDKYSYKGKKLFIRPPKDLKELFEEGRKLHHCVGTYGDRIIEGRSNVYFIRWNDKPDVPYFTLEVINGKITQVYGYGDKASRSTDKDLNEFILEWQTKTGFKGYRYSI